MLAMDVPKGISRVSQRERLAETQAVAEARAVDAGEALASKRWAISRVALRRPGTAARLTAGLRVTPTAPRPSPAIPRGGLRRRLAPARAVLDGGVAERDAEVERHLLRDAEQRVEAVHHLGVERRRQRADAEGVGGQHQVLAGGDDRVGPARSAPRRRRRRTARPSWRRRAPWRSGSSSPRAGCPGASVQPWSSLRLAHHASW